MEKDNVEVHGVRTALLEGGGEAEGRHWGEKTRLIRQEKERRTGEIRGRCTQSDP